MNRVIGWLCGFFCFSILLAVIAGIVLGWTATDCMGNCSPKATPTASYRNTGGNVSVSTNSAGQLVFSSQQNDVSSNLEPEKTPPPTKTPASSQDKVYIVQSGDTLGNIAKRFGTSVNAIAKANNIANVNNINAGQKLFIP